MLEYPTVKSSMQTAYIQTIEDGCTSANGLTITGIAKEDPSLYMYDGTIVSVENKFSLSIPSCFITHYDCSLQVGGATKSCDFNDNAGTFCSFDANKGALMYSSTKEDNTQFPKGTSAALKITAFTGKAGDVSLSLTKNLEFTTISSPTKGAN